jgi:hypothetical protein
MAEDKKFKIVLAPKPDGWVPQIGEVCVGFIRMIERDEGGKYFDCRHNSLSIGVFDGWVCDGGEARLKNATSSTGFQYSAPEHLRPLDVQDFEES